MFKKLLVRSKLCTIFWRDCALEYTILGRRGYFNTCSNCRFNFFGKYYNYSIAGYIPAITFPG